MYKWGLVVGHNMSPAVPGAGSAIFLHVWKDSATPTVGCTAMSEAHFLQILAWLKEEEQPLLLQSAEHIY
jgi:L,D-peptidoglycan transpeptidase YkuD (ErfK/YbiS/YcfS/YnhG family)